MTWDKGSIEKIDFQWADLEDPNDSPIKAAMIFAIRSIIDYHEQKAAAYQNFLGLVLRSDFEELKRLAANDKLEV